MEYEVDTDTTSAGTSRTVFQQWRPSDLNNNNGRDAQNQDSAFISGSSSVESKWKKTKLTDFFHVSRVTPSVKQQKVDKELLYLPVENVTTEELIKSGGRATVTVNDREIALVAHDNMVYAMEPKCPHARGPLHLGDIEEVPGCGPCIKCPWHSYTFSLSSGRCIIPQNRCSAQNLQIFPVRLSTSGNEIKIGFSEISPKMFSSLPE